MNDYSSISPALLAGLRRYLDAPGLKLLNINQMPRPTVLPGTLAEHMGNFQLDSLLVDLQLQDNEYQLGFILKRGNIKGEYNFHRFLAMHLPVLVPGMVTGEPKQEYLVLERLENLRPLHEWNVDDYRQAVDNLALLHDRFWGLEEDLDTFGGLARPMDRDFRKIKEACDEAVIRLTGDQPPHHHLNNGRDRQLFYAVYHRLDPIHELLKSQLFTLLHGDYWIDNLAAPLDGGRQIITTWDHAAIGPAMLDVVWFYQQIEAYLNPEMPCEAAVARYRAQMDRRSHGFVWSNDDWEIVWDYALLWNFATRWLPWLATCSTDQFNTLYEPLKVGWLDPASAILKQRFGIELSL